MSSLSSLPAVFLGLLGFVIYATYVVLIGKDYEFYPYRSPFAPLDVKLPLSPAIITVWIPVLFRLTCYYGRKVYYRTFLLNPPACAVDIPRNYKGETTFPLILMNLHRYFLYFAIILLIIHWTEAIKSFFFNGRFGIGIGSILILLDTTFLTLYISSCHSLRHLVGGGVDCFSCSKSRYKLWKGVSLLNERHGIFFWLSLFSIAIVDIYIKLLIKGIISDPRIIFG